MAFGRKNDTAAADTAAVAVRGTTLPPAPAQQPGGQALEIPADKLAQIEQMTMGIPEAGNGDSWGMLDQLLNAQDWQDLNKPWEGTSGRDLIGRRLMIRDVGRLPSQYEGGPTVFLVARGTDMGTGEDITFTSSAVMVIVQLAVLHSRDWLPAVVDVTVAKRPTKSGFLPYHLNVIEHRAGR